MIPTARRRRPLRTAAPALTLSAGIAWLAGIGLLPAARAADPPGTDVLHTLDGAPGDAAGSAVAAAGDVNADGFVDVVIGAPQHNPAGDETGEGAGAARVHSGADGSILHTFTGSIAGGQLGFSVGGAGDVDGDGFADVIVGAPFAGEVVATSGMARVFSGQDGTVLFTAHGDAAGDEAGFAVDGAGDPNGDGFADVIVGLPGANGIQAATGAARVFRGGAPGDIELLLPLVGATSGSRFGAVVRGAGDVDGDGRDDVAVGAPLEPVSGVERGQVIVISGRTGGVLHAFIGMHDGLHLGEGLAAGDVDVDGRADVIAGAGGLDQTGTNAGGAIVFRGADGDTLWTLAGPAAGVAAGKAVAAADVDHDGFADPILGAPDHDGLAGMDTGFVRVFSGKDATVLATLEGAAAGDRLGEAVAAAGDVDRDGFADFVAGAPGANGGAGLARVYAGSGDVGFVPGDVLAFPVATDGAITTASFDGLEKMKLKLRVSGGAKKTKSRVSVLDPNGAVVKSWKIGHGKKKVKKTAKLKRSGIHLLKVEALTGTQPFEIATDRKLPKGAQDHTTKLAAKGGADVATFEVCTLAGGSFAARIEPAQGATALSFVSVTLPNGHVLGLWPLDVLPDGSIELHDVPVEKTGAFTFAIGGLGGKKSKATATIDVTQPPKGTAQKDL